MRTGDRLAYLRQYPQGPLYAAVTGYYSLVYGNTGLERSENDVLAGSDPRLFVRRLADLFTGRDPAGGDVVLTLDPAAQKAAMAGLKGVTGAVVALDPATGKVLALASTPTYDPNRSPATTRRRSAARASWPRSSPDPRINQAISERYSPGSVFKLIVSAAALSSGKYTPQTRSPRPTGCTCRRARKELENYNGESCNHGADQALIDALTISCNTAFAQLGITLGEDKIRAHGRGVRRRRQGFDLPLHVAPSTIGAIDNDAQLGISSIGQQDVQFTPMQGAMIAAAIANQGDADEALPGRLGPGPRPDRHRQDRPGGDGPGRVSPRSPRRSPR